MKKFLNVSLAAALVAGSVVATAPEAFAKAKHHEPEMAMCMNDKDMGGIIVLGVLLGAVTGGVGSAVAYGSAYAVGGAAIGGGVGLGLGLIHHHHHCY